MARWRAAAAALAGAGPCLLLQGCSAPFLPASEPCPAGYAGHLAQPALQEAAASCARECDGRIDCLSFEVSHGTGHCSRSMLAEPEQAAREGRSLCRKQPLEAPLLEADDVVEQEGAQIQAGGDVRLYAVGASNVLWMTWIDQIHLYLRRLGFQVPMVPAETLAQFYPTSVQACDDSRYFTHLRTARLGRIGWNSWDFAYDGWGGCDGEGFRGVGGHRVMCEHGEGCAAGKTPFVRLSDIARDAGRSDVTIVSTWLNDNKQFQTNYRCFGGERILRENTSAVIVPTLQRTIRAIHDRSPGVWVVVVGKYPPTFAGKVIEKDVPWVRRLNARVREAVEREPRTLFVDYDIPGGGLDMYQTTAHYGHPNCRGSRLMAQAVLRRLWEAKVLARGLRPAPPGEGRAGAPCSELRGPACRASPLCWVHEGQCRPYGPGSPRFQMHPELPGWVPGRHQHS